MFVSFVRRSTRARRALKSCTTAGHVSAVVPWRRTRSPRTPRLAANSRSVSRSPITALERSEEHTLNSSHLVISYAVFCLKKKKKTYNTPTLLMTPQRLPYTYLHIIFHITLL